MDEKEGAEEKKGWLRRETMAVLKCYRIKAVYIVDVYII